MTYTYLLYIKSHCEAPDYENSVEADNQKQAIEKFRWMLKGEFDRKFIKENMIREDLIGKPVRG